MAVSLAQSPTTAPGIETPSPIPPNPTTQSRVSVVEMRDVAFKAFTVLTICLIVASILSYVTVTSFGGNFALRSIVLLSSILVSATCWQKDDVINKILKCIRVYVVVMGLVGLALHSPLIILAALATEIAIQAIELMRSKSIAQFGDKLGTIITNALFFSAMVTGLWQIAATAAAFNAFAISCVMLPLFYRRKYQDMSFPTGILAVASFFLTITGCIAVIGPREEQIVRNDDDSIKEIIPYKPPMDSRDFPKIPISATFADNLSNQSDLEFND